MSRYTPTLHKDLKPTIKRLLKQGWEIAPTGKGHVRVITPEGRTATILAGSTCNRRVVKKTLVQLRAAGADV